MIPSENLNDFCARAILRTFTIKHAAGFGPFASPTVDVEREMESLRFYWALSNSVNDLVRFLLDHPRSPLTQIDFEDIETYGNITGSLLAAQSVIEQLRRSDPCVFFVQEPTGIVGWSANRLVAWTLHEAFHTLLSTQRRYRLGEEYEWLHTRALSLDRTLRIQTIREILLNPLFRKRPSAEAQRACSRSKSQLYRLALKAFLLLDALEGGSTEAILTVLQTSVLPALATWRRFELATVLAVAEAFAAVTNEEVRLEMPLRGGHLVASVGQFEIHWQYAMPKRDVASLDKTERLANEMMVSLGVSDGTDLSDIVLLWRPTNDVVAIVECKWFESEDRVRDAIRDACSQVARYARDQYPTDDTMASVLSQQSLIVVSSLGTLSAVLDGSKVINLTDFAGLCAGHLSQWATSLTRGRRRMPPAYVA